MDMPVLKTKLGPARGTFLRLWDESGRVSGFPTSGTGRALTHEETLADRHPEFRGAYLVTEGKYAGRPPFHAVYGLVGGGGRIVIYDRFGLAARWEGAKPEIRRRGLRILASPEEILAGMWVEPAALLGYLGAYRCPACAAAKVEPMRAPAYMPIPLCLRCLSRGGKPRDWVGTWQCPACGDRVKDEVLACPFCAQLAKASGKPSGPRGT
jgi:hypothetical protein